MTDVDVGRDFPHVGASPGFIALCFYKKLSIWFGEGVRFVDKKFLLLNISKFSPKKDFVTKSLQVFEKSLGCFQSS